MLNEKYVLAPIEESASGAVPANITASPISDPIGFYGDNGVDGGRGFDGDPASDGYSPAGDGKAGAAGHNGANVTLNFTNDVVLDNNYTSIAAFGGNGGFGGDGGNAGDGKQTDVLSNPWSDDSGVHYATTTRYSSVSGEGGRGGNGGSGGDAAVTLLSVVSSNLTDIYASGGRGARGGDAGRGSDGFETTYIDQPNAGPHGSFLISPGAAGGWGGRGGDAGAAGSASVNIVTSQLASINVGAQGGITFSYWPNENYGRLYLAGGGGNGGGAQGAGHRYASMGGAGGAGGNGASGGSATITVDQTRFSNPLGDLSVILSATGTHGIAGNGGGGGGVGQVTYVYDDSTLNSVVQNVGAGGAGGSGGNGGNASVTFTNNRLVGSSFDEHMHLDITLFAGDRGLGAAGGHPASSPGPDGTNGLYGQTSLVFTGNTIDGGDGNDTFHLHLINSFGGFIGGTGSPYAHAYDDVFYDPSSGEYKALSAVVINLATHSFTIGAGANTIINIENIDVTLEDGYKVTPGQSDIDSHHEAGASITGDGHANSITTHLGNDTLVGNGGDDILNGGAGADVMKGGFGNDIFYVDNTADLVFENNGEGSDTIFSSVSYSLAGRFVETLTLTGIGNTDAIGNGQANTLNGNDGNNNLTGGSGDDILNGRAGNDRLDGGSGADIMAGGADDDTYIVDNTGDQVIENANEGYDTIVTIKSLTLGANIEAARLTSVGNLNLTGNELDNALTGGSGNNTLDGGLGADVMTGGKGDDTYYVDNTGDSVVENANEGTDKIISSVTYSLAGRVVENMTLSGADNIDATGNGLANTLNGNVGNNTIDGGFGADAMAGGKGDDTYIVDNVGDTVAEGSAGGIDLVKSSVSFNLAGQQIENLTLTGSSAISGTGNGLANILIGNGAANTLNGGYGADTLSGKGGADSFVFSSASGADTVTDFSTVQGDMINVNAYTHGAVHAAFIHQVGADTTIDLGGGNIITILNTTATDAAFLSHIVW